ncbi:MAG: hypothetical protein U5N58_01305 [Actinomycetota bacterium]|nr:hypothetical protein [Actinomycetota bacterium]
MKIFHYTSILYSCLLWGYFSPLQNRVKPIGAFGPCLLIDRKAYFSLGGHRHTKNRVLEDLALGKKIIDAKIPLTCLGGKGCIYFRMYPRGLSELINGYTKGFTIGAGSTSIFNIILVVLWISASFFPATAISEGITSGSWLPLAAGIGIYAAYVAQINWMSRKIGNFSIWSAILYPVFLVFSVIIIL